MNSNKNGDSNKTLIFLNGVQCTSCMQTTENALIGIKGIQNVKLDLLDMKLTIEYNCDSDPVPKVRKMLGLAGFGIRKQLDCQGVTT